MKFLKPLVVALLVGGTTEVTPQQDAVSLEDLMRMGAQLLQDNLDDNLLALLNQLDVNGAQAFFEQLEKKLNNEYVLDLAAFKPTAQKLLPILDSYEETAPYADWLRSRLDYMEAADQMRKLTPVPKVEPGKPAKPLPNPTPELKKKVWTKMIESRPIPPKAAPYVKMLKPLFAEQGLPEALVWLAELESAFNPKARSPVGAAGLYQFMPPTAKWLGLSTFLPDERLDPEKSARAAARYLKYLHGRFKDWKLVLAAYNLGEGRLRGVMEKQQAKTFEAVAARLPAETQMYVPKFAAILLKREGVSLEKLSAPMGGKR